MRGAVIRQLGSRARRRASPARTLSAASPTQRDGRPTREPNTSAGTLQIAPLRGFEIPWVIGLLTGRDTALETLGAQQKSLERPFAYSLRRNSLRGAIAALEAALKGARGKPSPTDEPPASTPDSPSSAVKRQPAVVVASCHIPCRMGITPWLVSKPVIAVA